MSLSGEEHAQLCATLWKPLPMLVAGGEGEESMMEEQMLKTVVKVWSDNEWREVST